MPDVRLVIGGAAYGGWKGIAITRGIEQIAGSYELEVSDFDPLRNVKTDVMPGRRASIAVDGETIITGYVDEVESRHSGSERAIAVRGRDAAADLVDGAAIHKTGEWRDQGMLAIARDIVRPYGISIRANAPLGKPFAKWNIEPGETAFENLDRMARHRGVLLTSDGKGGVLITQPSTARAPTSLRLGENILAGSAVLSYASRFSEYIVKGQRPRDEDSFGEEVTGKEGRAKDSGIGRHRPTVEVVEDVADAETLERRAIWRRNVNAGRSARASITVQGWSHARGLWQPNTLVAVTDSHLRMQERVLLIVTVLYTLDENGTRSELTLTPREALLPESLPERDDEDDFL